jgi:hypothetical protein
MVHRASSVVVALVLVLAMPAPGWARDKRDFWGWLERLSGPGPFEPRGTRQFPTIGLRSPFCLSNGRPAIVTAAGDDRRTCVYFDYAPWISKDDELLGSDVKLDTFDVGATYRPNRAFELGVGLGVYYFRTDGASATRLTVTPGRLVVRPLMLLGLLYEKSRAKPLSPGWQRGLSTLKWYYKTSVLIGRMDGETFGLNNALWRGETNEAISSVGLLVDLGEIFFER